MVEASPWPLLGSVASMLMLSGVALWFAGSSQSLFALGLFSMLLTLWQWWRDVCRESSMQGLHLDLVMNGMKWGMGFFILSEVMFFFSFFWAFFHHSLSPSQDLGGVWPPSGIEPLDMMESPLLGTLVLLGSGCFCTWAHHSILEGDYTEASQALWTTITLGMLFTVLQGGEYFEASFSIADSVYGSTFFMMTGFHGLHVIVGTILLMVMSMRLGWGQFSKERHFGFEAAAWYWHFVDVVWLFLFSMVYWWGS